MNKDKLINYIVNVINEIDKGNYDNKSLIFFGQKSALKDILKKLNSGYFDE